MDNVRLELVWPNKDKFLLSPSDESGKPVWVERTHPAAHEVRLTQFVDSFGEVDDAHPEADNLLFVGDGLDALRVLVETPEFRREYRGKVTLAYIDPPFNTGQSFEHYDDWLEHSTWLSFMRERLLLIRETLAPHGSIWVNLDDQESHRMRSLLDEVFGAGNFVASVYWLRKDTRANDARHFSPNTDTIHVYARSLEDFHLNRAPRPESMDAAYKNPDNDPNGPWLAAQLYAKSGSNTKEFVFSNGVVFRPPPGTTRRFNDESMATMERQGRIYFGKDGNGQPVFKQYLSEVKDGVVPTNNWHYDEVGSNRHSRLEQKALFPGRAPFSTAKPERLMERVLHLASSPGDIVLDVFAGSGTTAAVAHKMNRRWITAEISPSNAKDFVDARLRRVVSGEDSGGISNAVSWTGGGGFRLVQIKPSYYVSTPLGVMLTDDAHGPEYARAVAGQLGFDWAPTDGQLCGRRGRMRLAVVDGSVGVEEAAQIVSELGPDERATIVARSILAGVDEWLNANSRGSVCWKTPNDILRERRQRRRHGGDNA